MEIKEEIIIYKHGVRKVPIYFGKNKIKDLPQFLKAINFDKIAVITDENVKNFWGEKLEEKISSYGYKFFVLPNGEGAKEFSNYERTVNSLFDWKISKNSLIISFGGGAIGNLSGFIASTIYRGIKFLHIPTTIISQADGVIGGKQAINTFYGKNTLGSIYEPEIVLTDFNFLKTLPEKEIKSGIAESIKHALCQDKDFLKKVSKKNMNHNFISNLVEETIKLKIDIFEKDLKGKNESKIFIYGHEIGHAIESLSGGSLNHGESISIGMCCSAKISNSLGHLSIRDLEEHYKILKEWNLPTKIPSEFSPEDIIKKLESSGKLNQDWLELVLLKEIGVPLKTNRIVGSIIKKENLLDYIKICY